MATPREDLRRPPPGRFGGIGGLFGGMGGYNPFRGGGFNPYPDWAPDQQQQMPFMGGGGLNPYMGGESGFNPYQQMSYPELTSQQMDEAGLSRQEQNRVERGIIAPDIQGKISDWQTGRWTPEQIAAWEQQQLQQQLQDDGSGGFFRRLVPEIKQQLQPPPDMVGIGDFERQQQLQQQLQPAGAASPYFQDMMGRAAYEPQGQAQQAQQAQQLQQQLAGQQQALEAGLGGVGMYGRMQDGAAAAPARSYETPADYAQQEQKTAWEQQQQQAAAPVPQRWTPEEKASWAQQQLQQQLQQAQQQLQPPSDMMMTRSDTGESMTAEEYAARQAGYQPQTSPVPFQRSEVSRTPAPLERQQQRRLDQLRGRLSKLEGEVGIPPMLPQKPDMSIPPMLPQKPVFEGPLPGPRLPAPPKAIPDISLPGWMAPQTPEVGIPPMLPQKPVFEGPLPGPRLPPTPPRGIRAIPRLGASRGVFAKNPSKRRGGR